MKIEKKKIKEMKNTESKSKSKSTISLNFKEFRFYWIFEGNGEFKQEHDEKDYRRFVEYNYENRINRDY
jgi:hypothetical protein